MKKLIFILSISILIFWEVPSLAVDLSTYNYLQDMETVSSEDEIKIIIKFSKPIKKIKEPQFFEKSIQFTFNKTYIKPAKKIFKTGETIIPDISIYQYDKNSVRLRLVIGKKDIPFEDILKYEKKDNKLIITVSKKSMNLANDPYDEKLSLLAFDLEEYSSKPVELFSEKKELDKSKIAEFNENDENKDSLEISHNVVSNVAVPTLFSSSLRAVTALLIVLSLMLITFYFAKKYLLKEGSLLGMDKQIKILSTSYIAPKKSIDLVEIGGEVLVLGVTANNITLLTKIENKEVVEKIKGNRERPLIKPSFFSFTFNAKKSNRKKDKQISSAFSKQLDMYSAKAVEGNKKNDSSIRALNRLIQEKIEKLKIA